MTEDPGSEFASPESAQPAGRTGAAAIPQPQGFFGHPRGLATLFFTEMWERFSYYGMRALLILYMVAELGTDNSGLGWTDGRAGAVYGLYTGMVYLLALPGGWIADNLWGQRKAVFVGGCIIAAGHFSMAAPVLGLPEVPFFFLGLLLIVIGTGLLKPNVSTMVGELYPEGGARRDAGFSIYYMGINLGAILGPTFCSFLGEGYSFHWGFSLAGFGMVLGLVQYKFGDRFFGRAGLAPAEETGVLARRGRNFYGVMGAITALVVLGVFLVTAGVVDLSLENLALGFGHAIILLAILYFAYLILGKIWPLGFFAVWFVALLVFMQGRGFDDGARWASGVTLGLFILALLGMVAARRGAVPTDKRRLMVIFWLFLLAAIFWSGFEQAGSSLNLFAERLTDRTFGPAPGLEGFGFYAVAALLIALSLWVSWVLVRREDLFLLEKAVFSIVAVGVAVFLSWIVRRIIGGWEMPTGWLQNINPIFIVIFAPIFGWLWTWLAQRKANPSIPVKFALGLLGLAAGFFVLAWGATNATEAAKVSATWLVVTYFFHTVGELCLSPVGLSSMTKLAPAGRVGQMMGVWFIAAALGNLFAGLVAGSLENMPSNELFQMVAIFIGAAGIVAMILSPAVRKLMGQVD
jgi:POT family proton-dependent oligopeptide transporter